MDTELDLERSDVGGEMAALAQWTNIGMIDNSVNEMEVHIQQTNDRLQCIRQVTAKHSRPHPNTFSRLS